MDCLTSYLNSFFNLFENDDCTFLLNMFDKMNKLTEEKNCDFYSTTVFKTIEIIKFLTPSKYMKLIFLQQSIPKATAQSRENGRSWQCETLIGKLMTPHFLPTSQQAQYSFFTKPTELTQQDVDIQEKNIIQRQGLINSAQSSFVNHFIKDKAVEVRNKMLEWLG